MGQGQSLRSKKCYISVAQGTVSQIQTVPWVTNEPQNNICTFNHEIPQAQKDKKIKMAKVMIKA